MAVYALADTHLSTLLPKPMDIFGHRWIDWDKKLVRNWLETVTENDTVVLPGDISWGISQEDAREDLCLIDALPGKKLISQGNHDYWWSTVTAMNKFFAKNGIQTISILHNNAYAVDGLAICGTRGWYTDEKTAAASPIKADYEKIVERERGRLELSLRAAMKLIDEAAEPLEPVAFFHFPPVFGQYVCRPLVDTLHAYGITECFYGHIHSQYDIPPTTVFEGISFSIVSADYLQFRPKKIEIVN